MILRLLRGERALMAVVVMWPGAAIIGYMSAEVIGRQAASGHVVEPMPGPVAFGFAVMFSVLACVNYYSGGGMGTATRFHMALPIGARDLWVVRMLATLAPFPGAVAVGVVVYALSRGGDFTLEGLALGLNGVAVALFIPALYHSMRVRDAERGMPLAVFVPVLLAALAVGAILGFHTPRPAILFGSAAVLLLVTGFARVPRAFELHPQRGRASRRQLPLVRSVWGSARRLPVLGGALRLNSALRPKRWLSRDQYGLLILLGGAVNLLLVARSPLTVVLGPIIVQVAWFIRTANGASGLDHLPVKRDRIFRHAVLPGLAFVLVGLAVVVAWSESVSLGMLLKARIVPVTALVYVAAWFLSLGSVVTGMATPPSTPSGWRWRYARRWPNWGWVVLVMVLVLARLGGAAPGGVLGRLAQWIPWDVGGLWASVAATLAIAFLALQAGFRRVELVGLHRRLAP
ncbi:MAG: hypothetical protein LJF06_06940 [Gemmatimonadetes bacterium]|nr:hypothetical protein [Gemmatimonadota bacterium]